MNISVNNRSVMASKQAQPDKTATPRPLKDTAKPNTSTLSNISDEDSKGLLGKAVSGADLQTEIEEVVIEQRFQPIFSNLGKMDHEYLKKLLEEKDEEYGNQLLTVLERSIANETLKIQRANIKNKELKKDIRACEVELKMQRRMQDSDFNELKEISRHREELNKYEHEKGTLDKNIYETKKKINDINVEIQTLLGKIEANATYFNDLPEDSKKMLVKEIQENKVLLDFIKTKSFLRKFVS